MAEGAVNAPSGGEPAGSGAADIGGEPGGGGIDSSSEQPIGDAQPAPEWAIADGHVQRGDSRVSLSDLEDFSTRQRALSEAERRIEPYSSYITFTQDRWNTDAEWQKYVNALYEDDWQTALRELQTQADSAGVEGSSEVDPLAEVRREVESLRAQLDGQTQASAEQRAHADMQSWVAEVEEKVGELSEEDVKNLFEMANELGVFRTSTFKPGSGVNPLLKYVAPLVFADRVRTAEVELALADKQKNAERATGGKPQPRPTGSKSREEMTPEERQADKLRLATAIANPPSP